MAQKSFKISKNFEFSLTNECRFSKNRILKYFFHSQEDRFVKASMILFQVDLKNAFLKKISVISFIHQKHVSTHLIIRQT